MRKRTEEAIRAHARAEYPRECCGLIIAIGRKERYIPCRNDAKGTEHFVLNAEDYAAAEDQGKVIAVVHSHPDGPRTPSVADLVSCESSGLPWVMLPVYPGEESPLVHFEPSGYSQPLIGRPFFHGVLDCYTIVKDWYQRERGITLRDFYRPDNWWDTEQELYLDNFELAGFRRLPDGVALLPGDVILMQLRSKRTNHAGVYLGNEPLSEGKSLHPLPNAMLHHVYGYLSERVIYGGFWMQNTRMVLRYGKRD